MASWQAHLMVLALKLSVKRNNRRNTDMLKARAMMSRASPGVPPGTIVSAGEVGSVRGEWVRPAAGRSVGTLFYIHGGGYFACSPQTHRPITGAFASRGLNVFAPDYRLAPEHPFPAAVDDVVMAFRGLVASGIAAADITLAGDSAGGGLALAMLLSLRDAAEAMPAACVLFSPWTDLAGTGTTLETNRRRDAFFDGHGIERLTEPYLAGTDPRNPLASPLYGDLHGLPPLLIHVGTYEVLLDDSLRLAARARAAGVSVTLRSWPVVPHVWQMFGLPESADSLKEAADFLHGTLSNR
ncbi:alpha/beta hydrolase [Lichenicola cladoniae]|uniref:Alpha/beta hydrolase n=1 Tax=Lichenicola cladoniae TaxID=1484109 RepID=A0A6M8HM23_9PROT|nr:alpha/beta hydrolase [Lichenicola cladoniae]NPD66859.1 alpha/beta hydrolase [Acetobacteraceae bacterium]QKE89419.1 alpha/beta hydrolase [Lichenicola cladoniae]